jgi:predicted phosphodiesterase
MRAMTHPRDDIIQPPYLYTIFGQHDLRFHSSNRENTPLAVLEAAEACYICQEDPYIVDWPDENRLVYIYGANWGEEIPPVRRTNGIHILLIHKLILEDTEGWEQNYISVDNMFRFCKHDVIVCGDNHQSFMREKKGRLLFNCGSLMRNRIDQKEHKPVVYIVDTSDMSYEAHYIPIKPFDEVMNVERAEKRKARNEELESFVNKLSGDTQIEGLDFLRNLEAYMTEKEVPANVKEFIEEMLSCET